MGGGGEEALVQPFANTPPRREMGRPLALPEGVRENDKLVIDGLPTHRGLSCFFVDTAPVARHLVLSCFIKG